MRSSFVRENLQNLRYLGESTERRVRESVDPEVLQGIEQSTKVTWVPLQYDIELTRAVVAVSGFDAMMAWGKEAFIRAVDKPLLSAFVKSGLRIFGGRGVAVLRIVPRGYMLVIRNAGTLGVEVEGPARVSVVGVALPRVMRDDIVYLRGVGTVFLALSEFNGVQAALDVEVVDDRVIWTVSATDPP
ncbi:MAG: hypothetical protein AAF799_08235 [Myxococcota bacterium]